MHGVDRGREPKRLKPIRTKFTRRWVQYYTHGMGRKPSDSHWRRFQPDLSRGFDSICGYCEEICMGHVDHFHPKSGYPHLVYQWTNWILACNFCNQSKGEKWPVGGYIDPCAAPPLARPESCFTFDSMTTEIVPLGTLQTRHKYKAARMIEDLKLNSYHHLKKRTQWLKAVSEALNDCRPASQAKFIKYITSREQELSSISRHFLCEQGYSADVRS
jgi:uncharacterized protein (TIGR02646 family)